MNGLKMDEWLGRLPSLKGVHREKVELDHSFEQTARAFAMDPGTILLLSGSELDSARYHILAAKPWLEVRSRGKTVTLQIGADTQLGSDIRSGPKEFTTGQDPFSVIDVLLARFKLPDVSIDVTSDAPVDLPVVAGLFGYFSYDLKDWIENLPRTCLGSNLPDLLLYAPSILLVQDKQTARTWLCIPEFEHETGREKPGDIIQKTRDFFFDRIHRPVKGQKFFMDGAGFRSSFTKSEYTAAVKKIIDYLTAGDIYQANLSQRFETGFSGDGFSLFLDLFQRNPAPFFSYIHAGDHTIVSTSPERFIRQDGRHVETRPIKGTIARGRTREQDLENGVRLTKSLKDDAELTMIVDLMRNDISRVTQQGSVIVQEHKRLEPYDNVFHLVSIVEGRLEAGKTSMDLLRATFPGGSITGCPKIRSMEIIDELEPVKRHVYTGAIGYVGFHDCMDLSIAIRTAVIENNNICFSVGGGIVYDSDPELEFQETLDKGKTLMESLSGTQNTAKKSGNEKTSGNAKSFGKVKAWVNGKIIDQDDAVVSAASPGFQYGAGLFETLLVRNDNIFCLEDHVSRMNQSWTRLFNEPGPDITWADVIHTLIRANNFEADCVAVKLLISRDPGARGRQLFLAAFARKYIHRLELLGKPGLDLVTYPHPRQSPLAGHKTLNYLYYDRAGQFVRDHGADEALILNPDLTVSETNTAGIFAIQDNRVIIPESDHVLPSVTLKSVLKILADQGVELCRKKIPKDVFCRYPNIMLANALMGAVKVLSIDNKRIEHTKGLGSMINQHLKKGDAGIKQKVS